MGQLQERYKHYREPQKFMEADVYPYFRAIEGKQGTEVEMGGHKVLMFGSNAYTGLTGDQRIIDAAKAALDNSSLFKNAHMLYTTRVVAERVHTRG